MSASVFTWLVFAVSALTVFSAILVGLFLSSERKHAAADELRADCDTAIGRLSEDNESLLKENERLHLIAAIYKKRASGGKKGKLHTHRHVSSWPADSDA